MKIENKTLFLEKGLDKVSIPGLMQSLKTLKSDAVQIVDMAELETIDSAGVVFIDFLKAKFPSLEQQNVSPQIQQTLSTFQGKSETEVTVPKEPGFFEQMGSLVFETLSQAKEVMYLVSDILYWSIVGLFNKKGQRKESFIQQAILIGVDAVPIIGLLSFILGLILALQSAVQLKQFGADIFLVDLISVTMISEMGPMLTAIMVSGRSGSAIASEIATMKVTEEIDALKMMALDPIRFVVVPKFHAMTVCMPLLVTLSMFVGILGGAIIGFYVLNISPQLFWSRVIEVANARDFFIAVGKSIVFSWVIVIIGVYYGLNVKGGAEGVGKVTTTSVVASIFWIIVLDAVNSLIFYF
ncbi:MAG: ABC transporter permease [Candidatus Cloacimonetes bacterium]|nr:ABC transporter permease [Candidatus Cloacimonadota bacterium]